MSDLTVVIPTIMRRTLPRTISSVLDQTILFDDVVIERSTSEFCGVTQNAGVARVTTEWVGFCHDDDTLHPMYHEWFDDECKPDTDLFVFVMEFGSNGPLGPGLRLPSKKDPATWQLGDVGISFVMRTQLCRQIRFTNRVAEDWMMIEAVRDRGCKIQVSQRVAYFVRP